MILFDSFIRSFARPQNDSCALSSSCMCVSLVPCMLMLRSSSQNLTIMMYECITRTLYADATRSSSQNLTIIGTYLVVYHILLWTIRLRFSNWILFRDFTHGHANFKLHTHRQRNNGTLLLMMYIVHFMHCTVLALALFIKVGVR